MKKKKKIIIKKKIKKKIIIKKNKKNFYNKKKIKNLGQHKKNFFSYSINVSNPEQNKIKNEIEQFKREINLLQD